MDAYSSPKSGADGSTGQFLSPGDWLSDIDAPLMGEIATAAADIALIIEDGIVRDVAVREESLLSEGFNEAWLNKPWQDTVTSDSRSKIDDLLSETPGPQRWRQVNHPSQTALDVPIRYTALKLGRSNRIIALGRDLRSVSTLQQRLVEAHQELERDYVQMRDMEGRYRLLFDVISEPVIVADMHDQTIEEANPALGDLLGLAEKDLHGSPLQTVFDGKAAKALDAYLGRVLSKGTEQLDDIMLSTGRSATLAGSVFRQGRETRLILRLLSVDGEKTTQGKSSNIASYVDDLPDAVVISDSDQRILAVNAAFSDLTQTSGETETKGARLQDYLGRSGTDLNVLFSTLRKHGVVRNFATITRSRFGAEEPAEVSAVSVNSEAGDVYAFSIRNVARRLNEDVRLDEKLPSSASQFIELVGRVPLKDIVSESTALIERLCIEAALDISNNNRASAAEMLGLSRQGLYLKLKRVGLDERGKK